MAGWHHWLDGRESQWTLGVGEGQGGLACCDSWGCKEWDTTERLIWSEVIEKKSVLYLKANILDFVSCTYYKVRDSVHRHHHLLPILTQWFKLVLLKLSMVKDKFGFFSQLPAAWYIWPYCSRLVHGSYHTWFTMRVWQHPNWAILLMR